MDQFRVVLRPISVTLVAQSFFMALCACVAVFLGEYESFKSFGFTILIILSIAAVLWISSVSRSKSNLSIRGGILLVTFMWIAVTLAGALPYIISKSIPAFADAYFESVSGFTTTGATILADVESLPKSIVLWRAFTHWLGGGGIVVLSVAVLPLLGIGGSQMMKAETSGVKKEKLTPRIAQTAKYLWLLYTSLTVILIGFLLFGGMGFFDAICQAFSAISTGGLSSRNASVAYFNSFYIEMVLTVFMLIGSMNFVLLIKVARGDVFSIFKDSEFKAFILIYVVATAGLTFFLYGHNYETWKEAFRYASFQVATIYSTTGFSTADFETWIPSAQVIIFLFFFIGGCSGSTSGGIKVVRHVIMLKQLIIEMKYLIHPKAVYTMRLNGMPVERRIVFSVMGFFSVYITTVLIATVIVSTSGLDVFSSFTGVLGTIGTIGPGFGALGPSHNYSFLPDYIKYVFSVVMLIGRLEFYTFIIVFTPWFWQK